MSILIEQVNKNNPDLKYAEIEGILYLIKNTENLSNNDLVRLTGLPKETLRIFKNSISSLLEQENDDLVKLNKEGENFLSSLEVSPFKWSILEYSDIGVESKLKKIRDESGLSSKRNLDQFFAIEKSSYSKAAFLMDKGLLKGKKITLLGDDDLLSFTIPFLSSDYSRIDVYDIDEDLLSFLTKKTEELKIPRIYFHKHDVREQIGRDAFFGTDLVVVDPPYTKTGVLAFLNRAVELLGQTDNQFQKYVVLFYGNSYKSPEKTLKIQEIINNFGFVIEDKINKFSRYIGAESIGSASSLYLLQATKATHVLEEYADTENIYSYQDQKEEKFPMVEHVTVKAFDVSDSILSSKKNLLKIFGNFCDEHDLRVMQKDVIKFKGGGMSLTFILSNSNLLVHTWPEYKALHIDILTCSIIKNKNRIRNTLEKLLGTSKIIVKNIE